MLGLNDSRVTGALVTDTFAARACRSLRTSMHAQHGAAIFVSVDADVIVTDATGGRVAGRVVVVPPDLEHAVACPGPVVKLLFDPEQAPHVAAFSRRRGAVYRPDTRVARRFDGAVAAHRAFVTSPDVLGGIAQEASEWLHSATRPPMDRRVAKLLETLRDPGGDRRAALAGLPASEAHLRELFARDVGLPMRTYQLWRRLLLGISAASRMDVTSAAHFAGFADLAHFSRTCRRMVGESPTQLAQGLLRG